MKYLIGVFLFCSAMAIPGRVFCYDTNVAHPKIAEIATKLFNENADQKLTEQEIKWIVQGAIEEDTPTRWLNHFFDPVYNKGIWFGKQQLSAKNWAQNPQAQTNFALGDKSWQRAIDDYKRGDKEKTFKALGHIIHLISDMTVPAHTRDDIHIVGDSYEQFLKNNWSAVNGLLKSNFAQANNLNDIFDYLAKYSNSNFYSDDTIEDGKYKILEVVSKEILKKGGKNYLYNYTQNGDIKYKIYISEDDWLGIKKGKLQIDPFKDGSVIVDYYRLLLPKAIGSSAGVIKLFFDNVSAEERGASAENLPASRTALKGYADRVVGAVISGASNAWDYLKGKFGAKSEPAYGEIQSELASASPVLSIIEEDKKVISDNLASETPSINTKPQPAPEPQKIMPTSPAKASEPVQTPPSLPQSAPIQSPVIITPSTPKVSPAPVPIVYSYSGGSYSGGGTSNQNNQTNNTDTSASTSSNVSTSTSTYSTTSTPPTLSAPPSDVTPPTAPIISAQFLSDIYTSSSAYEIAGTNSTDTAKIFAYQTSASSSTDIIPQYEQTASGTDFSFLFTLNPGHNYIYFTALDSAGNTSTASNIVHIVFDSASPPVPTIAIDNQSGVASTNIHIALSGQDELSPATYYDLSYAISSTTLDWQEIATSTPVHEFDFSGERGQSYLFKARAIDSLGNSSDWTSETKVSVDWSKEVVLNEVAWAGTSAQHSADEWMEFYNNTDSAINLRYWKIFVSGRQINWTTSTVKDPIIPARGYFLLERTKDDRIPDIPANIIYTLDNGLNNSGEKIELLNPEGVKIDEVDCSNGWFAGNNTDYRSMERIDPLKPGGLASNWQSSLGLRMDGRSYGGEYLNGSPKQPNLGFLALRHTQQEADLVLSPENNPYVLEGYTVPAGKNLTIKAGTVIKSHYKDSNVNVYGTLSVDGTAEAPVVFTSGRDQSFSNGLLDTIVGAWTGASPAPQDWIGIWLYPKSSSTISNAQIRYAGYPARPPGGDIWTQSVKNAVRAENSTVNISNSLFQNNGGTTFYLSNSASAISNASFAGGAKAIDSWNSALALSNSSFADFTDAQGPVVVHNTWPSIKNISFASNTLNKIFLSSVAISEESARINKDMSLSCYFDSLRVGSSSTLNIDPGAEVRLANYASIEVRGTLNSLGAADEQVLFRPLTDDSGWGQIEFINSTSTIQNTRFWRGNHTYTSTWDTDGMLFAVNSNLILDNVYLEDARRPGNSLQASNSFVAIKNSHIQDATKYTSYSSSVGRGVMARGGKVIFDNDYFSRLQIGISADSVSVLEFISMLSQNFENVDFPVDWSGWGGFPTSTL